MARTIGSRELKGKLGAVLREVRERGTEYEVTLHGKVVAKIVPDGESKKRKLSIEAWLRLLDETAREISQDLPPGPDAVALIREARDRLIPPEERDGY